jgi:hypothetical protein
MTSPPTAGIASHTLQIEPRSGSIVPTDDLDLSPDIHQYHTTISRLR